MSKLLHTESLDSPIYQDAKKIRLEVFVKEQQVPVEIEIADEEKAIHCVLYDETNHPLGTVRLLPIDDTQMKIQRMAVIKEARGSGVGKEIMTQVETIAKENGANTLVLGAQLHALEFYRTLGYTPFGDTYIEATIKHQNMKKTI